MKLPLLNPVRYRAGAKAVAIAVFLATPGSLLMLPLLMWWMARRGQLTVPAAVRN